MRPLSRFTRLLLAAEALSLLTVFRIALELYPIRRILRAIAQTSTAEVPPQLADEDALAQALQVRWAVEAVVRHSPIAFVCFPQTLTGYIMLRRRRIASTMVYGVARSPAGDLIAHTWLTLGDRIVVGGDGSGGFEPLDRWT